MDTGFAAWLKGWFDSFLAWVLALIADLLIGVWDLLSDFLIFVFDKVFDLVLYIVSGLSWSFGSFSPATYWAMLPADLINVLNLIGVPIALGMIVAALSIRFVLQLIPFVRWGS